MFAGSILKLPCYATITVTPKRVTNAACRCHVFTIADALSIAGEPIFVRAQHPTALAAIRTVLPGA
jgi:hypothetical protein